MPYIVVKTCFPNERATEAAKKFLEVIEKYPPDDSVLKVVLQSAIDVDENGIHGLSVSQPQEGKLEEALRRTEEIMVEYLSVPDYRWEIKLMSTPEEALKYIGMG